MSHHFEQIIEAPLPIGGTIAFCIFFAIVATLTTIQVWMSVRG